jgi:hypothetical protein
MMTFLVEYVVLVNWYTTQFVAQHNALPILTQTSLHEH